MIQAVWRQLIPGGELRVEFSHVRYAHFSLFAENYNAAMLTKPTEIQDRSSHEPECWS